MIIRDFTKLPLLAEGGEGLLYRYKGMVIKCYKPCGFGSEAKESTAFDE